MYWNIIIIINIIIHLFIEGNLISAQALFSLRALFGAMRIHSYMRMASLIKTLLNDLYVTKIRHFRREKLWVQLYPRMKAFLIVPRRASNHRRTTSLGLTLISAPTNQLGYPLSAPTNQLGYQGGVKISIHL